MNIVVSNVKGGVGKTTTSVYLAAVAARRGKAPVLLVHADPQGSSAERTDVDPFDGVELIQGPSVRTVTKAMNQEDGTVVVDVPPGEGTVVQAALARADAVVIPTRAGGIEPNRVVTTLEMTPSNVPAGVVICSARLGTNDLEATIAWWTELKVPVWGIIPERVSIRCRAGVRALDGGDRNSTARCSKRPRPRPARAFSACPQRGEFGPEAAVGPGHGGLPLQLADDLRDEPPPHRNAGSGGRQREKLGREPELSASSSTAP